MMFFFFAFEPACLKDLKNLDRITGNYRPCKVSDTSWGNWICHPQGGAKPSSFRLQVPEM